MRLQRPFEDLESLLIEIRCGVQFDELHKLNTGHIGPIWELYKSEGYTEFQERIPLRGILEHLHDDEVVSPIGLDTDFKMPFPRLWFLHRTSGILIQIQRNHFVFNWIAVTPETPYPGLDFMANNFEKYLRRFEDFMKTLGEPIKRRQYELGYLNHIPRGDSWENLEDLGVILSLITKNGEEHFLNKVKRVNWLTSFQFSADARLDVTISNRLLSRKKAMLQVEWSAHGPLIQPSMPKLVPSQKWFILFDEQIRQKYRDLFNEESHP